MLITITGTIVSSSYCIRTYLNRPKGSYGPWKSFTQTMISPGSL